jgi:hypothetical protein
LVSSRKLISAIPSVATVIEVYEPTVPIGMTVETRAVEHVGFEQRASFR